MGLLLCACGSKGNLYQANEPEIAQKNVIAKPQSNSENSEKKQP